MQWVCRKDNSEWRVTATESHYFLQVQSPRRTRTETTYKHLEVYQASVGPSTNQFSAETHVHFYGHIRPRTSRGEIESIELELYMGIDAQSNDSETKEKSNTTRAGEIDLEFQPFPNHPNRSPVFVDENESCVSCLSLSLVLLYASLDFL